MTNDTKTLGLQLNFALKHGEMLSDYITRRGWNKTTTDGVEATKRSDPVSESNGFVPEPSTISGPTKKKNQGGRIDSKDKTIYSVLFSQLCSLSSQLRSKVKNALTKPYLSKPTPSGKLVTPLLSDKAAPWISGQVNGKVVSIILDGGCVPNLISLKLLMPMNIKEFDEVNLELHTADGNITEPLGEIKGLTMETNGQSYTINAVVMEHSGFDLLLGRHALHQCRIKTDWTTHEWTLDDKPFTVSYESFKTINEDSDDDSVSDGYYVQFTAYNPTGKDVLNKEELDTGSGRFTDQLGRIMSKFKGNKLLTTKQRTELTDLVNNYKEVFGTSFAHVVQTKLLNFEVNTGNSAPIYRRPYAGLSWQEKTTLEHELQKILNDRIIVPAKYGAGFR